MTKPTEPPAPARYAVDVRIEGEGLTAGDVEEVEIQLKELCDPFSGSIVIVRRPWPGPLTAPPAPTDRITLTRDKLAALLAHHADVIATHWRAVTPWQRAAAQQLDEHAHALTADEETPAVGELLDSMMAFEAEHPAETDEERADREETERDHARGDHTYCGITCETEMPTEQLRNFVIAKGYPGTAGALDELLRRARTEATVLSVPADQATDVVAAVTAALQKRAGELSELAEEQMRPSLEERAQEWSEAAEVARRVAEAATAKTVQPFVPPAHYRRDDGVECCVHAIPIGPDSCRHCRELTDDAPAAAPSAPADRADVDRARAEGEIEALTTAAEHIRIGLAVGPIPVETRPAIAAFLCRAAEQRRERALKRVNARRRTGDEAQHPAGTHVYLSTGCHHGAEPFAHGLTGHEYCQSKTGVLGSKTPAQCKGETCGAPCVCPCHTADEAQPSGPCSQHPAAPTFDGKCGGCTQYPADMIQAQQPEGSRG